MLLRPLDRFCIPTTVKVRGQSHVGLNSDFSLPVGVIHNTKLQEIDGLMGNKKQNKYK